MIPDKTTVAILSKSGSGKSTLMHTMSGLDRPQSGEVIVDGQDILKLKQRAVDSFRSKKGGFIFPSLFCSLERNQLLGMSGDVAMLFRLEAAG